MVDVDRLIGANGNVRDILNLPVGVVEWTNRSQLARLEVLRGLAFEDFEILDAEIGINFVECRFDRCGVKDVRTDAHFWGAGDVWRDCSFAQSELRQMISPMNSFFGCRFDAVLIEKFKPYQTLFVDCSFVGVSIDGLRAHLVQNRQMVNPDLKGKRGQVVFRNCRFESSSFRRCYFAGAVFEQCTFADVVSEACSFEGITSDVTWWGEQKTDPFSDFLSRALAAILAKCGRDSAAYREFENYVIDYGSGRTTSRDFSACLYTNRVPYEETEKVIGDLKKLISRHPF